MDDEELEALGFVEDGAESPEIEGGTSLPRGALVLPGYDVEGTPEGTGSVRERAGYSRRKTPQAEITPEVRERQLAQEARAAGDPGADVVQAFTGLDIRGGHMGREETQGAQGRTRRLAHSAARRASEDPEGTLGAAVYGPISGLTSGLLDEVAGLQAPIQAAGSRAIADALGVEAPDVPESVEEVRARRDELRGRAPEVMGVGEVAGEAAQIAIPPLRAETVPGRIMASAGEGALYGAAHGMGYSDPTSSEEALLYGGSGAAMGALGGAAVGTPDAVTRRALRGLSDVDAARSALDDATLAGVSYGGGGISDRLQRFERGSGGSMGAREGARARMARELRDADVIRGAETTRQTEARIRAARERVQAQMDALRTDMGDRGATGADVAARLRAIAERERTEGAAAMGSPVIDGLEAAAEAIEGAYGDRVITYDRLMAETRALRQRGARQTPGDRVASMSTEALDEADSALRGAYDDAVEGALGPERREAYRGARRRYAALTEAEEMAHEGASREATRSPAAIIAGSIGAGATTGATTGALTGDLSTGLGAGLGAAGATAVGGLVAGQIRSRSPRIAYRRAVSAERMARFLQTPGAQRLGRFAGVLQRAAQRGAESLTSTMYVLSQRDAEFRALMDEIDFEEDPYAATPAVEAIAGSGEEMQP